MLEPAARRNASYYFGKVSRGGNWRGIDMERKGLLKHDCGIGPDGNSYGTRYGDVKKHICCARQCCAFNISYIVSAPLHYQGFYQFWYAADCIGQIVAFVDVLLHVLLWVAALVLDCWIVSIDNLGHQWMRELQIGALVCLGIALFGLLVAQVLGVLGQPAGKSWPSTVGLIMGGGAASAVFTLMFCLSFSFAVPALLDATDPLADPPYVTVRHCALASLPIKIFALATARANIDFWGSCEQADKLDNICAFMARKRASGETIPEVGGTPIGDEKQEI